MDEAVRVQERELIFALDIGTRSIIGVVGEVSGDRLRVLALESAEHGSRAMVDGQIDNIRQVAALARTVTQRLEERLDVSLERVCVAAAGRALRTQKGSFTMELPGEKAIDAELISRLEAGAVSRAEEALQDAGEEWKQLFLVGYTVAQYRLDNYPLTVLLDHRGKVAEVDVVATFLPGEVVESLYAAMKAAGLQVASITLEPIAAMNAAIPAELRLLNLALVDIGAGTTDIALCRDGSVVGYTMATVAGDEVTEAIMRACLVDFATAEQMKRSLKPGEDVVYCDILGLENSISCDDLMAVIQQPMDRLAEAIAQQVLEVNTAVPSALFLAGGGSKLAGMRQKVAANLGMDEKRVAIAGHNFGKSAFSDEVDLDDPEYTTPLGIAVSAGLGLLNDSYLITLNGQPAKLFRSGALTVRDVLMMNGYRYNDMIGSTGKNLTVTLDGRHVLLRGEPAAPAILTVGGQPSTIGAVIHAGDQIDFEPARSGRDAEATLGSLLGEDHRGRVLLNNREMPLDTPLRNGDVILTMERAEAALAHAGSGGAAAPSIPAPAVEEEPAAAPAAAAEPTPVSAPEAPAAPASSVPAAGAPAEPAREQEPVPPTPAFIAPLEILLNDEPLVLPPKADGGPYYLMDLLEHSGIDFDKLDRPVRLSVNGVECGFQKRIQINDSVIIRAQ